MQGGTAQQARRIPPKSPANEAIQHPLLLLHEPYFDGEILQIASMLVPATYPITLCKIEEANARLSIGR